MDGDGIKHRFVHLSGVIPTEKCNPNSGDEMPEKENHCMYV